MKLITLRDHTQIDYPLAHLDCCKGILKYESKVVRDQTYDNRKFNYLGQVQPYQSYKVAHTIEVEI